MVHNPGGDWNPGQGDNPTYPLSSRQFESMMFPVRHSDFIHVSCSALFGGKMMNMTTPC